MGFLPLFLNYFSPGKSPERNRRWEHGWPRGSFYKWPVDDLVGAEETASFEES